MPFYRPVLVSIWRDDKFQNYSPEGKLLFLYLITNDHMEECGVYKITTKTIANETDIDQKVVISLLKKDLTDNVSYDWENHVVFVHNFLWINFSLMGGNPDLIKRSVFNTRKALRTTLWKEFDKCYTTDLQPLGKGLATDAVNVNVNVNFNVIKEIEEGKIPFSFDEGLEKKVQDELKKISYPYSTFDMTLYVTKTLIKDYPEVEALEAVRQKCAWWLDNPKALHGTRTKKVNPHSQMRTWFRIEQAKINEVRKERGVGKSKKKSVIPFRFWNEVAGYMFEKGATEREVVTLWIAAEKHYQTIVKEKGEDIDPKTFISLVRSMEEKKDGE